MKKTKMRLFTCLLAVVLCMAAFSMSAFAYADAPETVTETATPVLADEDAGTEPDALTPEGNLTLVDDIQQTTDSDELENKQFITVQSKAGNYFYLIIDRSGDTENVYFLNLVDEADLMALIEEDDSSAEVTCTCADKCVVGSIDTSCPVCASNMSECTGAVPVVETPEDDADAETDTEKSGSSSLLLVVLLVVIGGGAAVYYFKFRKPGKPQTSGPDDLDDYDYGEDDADEDENEDETEYELDEDTDVSSSEDEDTEETP